MDLQDSTPVQNPGDQDDHSLEDGTADNVDESQPSNEDDNQFFGNEDTDDSEDDTPSQATNDDDDTSNDVDPELTKWAKSQNISLTTETEIALAKRLRDTQKSYHEKSTEIKQKYTDAANDTNKGDSTALIEAKLARMEFFDSTPDARELEGDMFDIALEARDSGDDAGFKYYQTPQGWKTLYKIAKANKADSDREASYETGRKEERTNLAKKQQAGKPSAKAVNSAPTASKKVTDEQIGNMTTAEYAQFRKDNPDWDPFRS